MIIMGHRRWVYYSDKRTLPPYDRLIHAGVTAIKTTIQLGKEKAIIERRGTNPYALIQASLAWVDHMHMFRRIVITDIISEEEEIAAETAEATKDESGNLSVEGTSTEGTRPPGEQAVETDESSPIIQMVQVENVLHAPFKLTQEVKAVAAEVIKTIRDIIALNQLYKESLAQLIEAGKKVVDNPTHLADFGKVDKGE